MKRLLMMQSILCASPFVALAADLPVRAPAPAPVFVAPLFTWTGFYAGVNAGYAWSAGNNINTFGSTIAAHVGDEDEGGPFRNRAAAAALGATTSIPAKINGFIGGGQIGYNWQLSSSLVIGVEADIQGIADSEGSGTVSTIVNVERPPGPPGSFYATTLTGSRKLDYLGTVRARLGFLVTPSLLAYATGGLAYGKASARVGVLQTLEFDEREDAKHGGGAHQPVAGSLSFSDTKLGFTVGAGAEWKFTQNWSAKIEYLYFDLGSQSGSMSVAAVGPSGPPISFVNAIRADTEFKGHIVRAGLNYHFGGPAAPVVARY